MTNRYTGIKEIEANVFAMAFLMPKDNFIRVCNRHTADGVCDLEKVAEDFKVDVKLAHERGLELGIFSNS